MSFPWPVQYLSKGGTGKKNCLLNGRKLPFWRNQNKTGQKFLKFASMGQAHRISSPLPPSDDDFVMLPAWWPCVQPLSFVYITVIVTLSSYRVRHHDRRLHHVHQCLHLYRQLSTHQPSDYIWPSEPAGLLKLSTPDWNVRDGLQTAIFLIINLHSLTCLFSNPVSSFCKLLEHGKKKKKRR